MKCKILLFTAATVLLFPIVIWASSQAPKAFKGEVSDKLEGTKTRDDTNFTTAITSKDDERPLSVKVISTPDSEMENRSPAEANQRQQLHMRYEEAGVRSALYTRLLILVGGVQLFFAGLQVGVMVWQLHMFRRQLKLMSVNVADTTRLADLAAADQRPWIGIDVEPDKGIYLAGANNPEISLKAILTNYGSSPATNVQMTFETRLVGGRGIIPVDTVYREWLEEITKQLRAEYSITYDCGTIFPTQPKDRVQRTLIDRLEISDALKRADSVELCILVAVGVTYDLGADYGATGRIFLLKWMDEAGAYGHAFDTTLAKETSPKQLTFAPINAGTYTK